MAKRKTYHKQNKRINLSYRQKSDLFFQLATMEEAGLPAAQAFGSLYHDAHVDLKNGLSKIERGLKAGQPIASVGKQAGIFNAFDESLIRPLVDSGNPASAYRRLGEFYDNKAVDQSAMRSRLMYPVVLFVIAVFIQPFKDYIIGTIDGIEYLVQVFQVLFGVMGVAFIVWNLPAWLHDGFLKGLGLGRLLDRGLINMPIWGSIHIRRNVQHFMYTLGLLLDAGIPILDALPKAVNTMPNSIMRLSFQNIAGRIRGGQSFTESIQGLSYLQQPACHEFITTGEMSGRLADMLMRYAEMERATIRDFDQQVAEWLPRVVYAVLAFWIASGIISGGPIGSTTVID